jgi:hypothetical protein
MEPLEKYFQELIDFLDHYDVVVNYIPEQYTNISHEEGFGDGYDSPSPGQRLYINGLWAANEYNIVTTYEFFEYLKDLAKRFRKAVKRSLVVGLNDSERKEYFTLLIASLIELYESIEYNDQTKNYEAKNLSLRKLGDVNEINEDYVRHLSEALYWVKEFISKLIFKVKQTIANIELAQTSRPDPKKGNMPKHFSYSNQQNSKNITILFNELVATEVFISSDSHKKNFRQLFFGPKVDKPIIWSDSMGALKYLILQLESKDIIKNSGRNKWKLVSQSFINEDTMQNFEQGLLSGAKVNDISSKKKEMIDDIIDKLFKGNLSNQ